MSDTIQTRAARPVAFVVVITIDKRDTTVGPFKANQQKQAAALAATLDAKKGTSAYVEPIYNPSDYTSGAAA